MLRVCVSSKSRTCELMPLIRAAFMISKRSRRPRMLACEGPENGARADTATPTVSCRVGAAVLRSERRQAQASRCEEKQAAIHKWVHDAGQYTSGSQSFDQPL